MNCPICMIPLNITERQGIELDFCPKCRGVWLDRGELDKIIERSTSGIPSRPNTEQRYNDDRDKHYDEHSDKHHGDQHGKRRGFLHDLFD
jgi:Zn-finger nucleic acid-binding protein